MIRVDRLVRGTYCGGGAQGLLYLFCGTVNFETSEADLWSSILPFVAKHCTHRPEYISNVRMEDF